MLVDEGARELARRKIILDRSRIALFRLSVPTGAGCLHHHRFILVDQQVRRLGRQRHLGVSGELDELSGAAAVPAENAPGPVGETLALTRERHRMADRAHHAAKPEPAAMLAGAA